MNDDAASEVGVVGQEGAEAGGVHVAEDLLVIEVVEANDDPGARGAKFLVTPLTNSVLPLGSDGRRGGVRQSRLRSAAMLSDH